MPDGQLSTPELPNGDANWFGGRRWTGIVAIAVVILVGLCLLVLVLNQSGTSDVGVTRHQASSPPSNPLAAPTDLPTRTPIAPPPGTEWDLYGTVALPRIDGEGPSRIDGSIATGFARTPVGALLAVTNEGFRYGLAPDREWRRAAAAMLDPAAIGYAAWIRVRHANPYGRQGADGGDPTQLAQIAGFQFVSYTPEDAIVQLVTRDSDGDLQVGVEHVTWRQSDWKFVLAPDGGQTVNVQQLSSLAGFVPWGGV